ncbi:hypothetical protein GJ744_006079 [Endocarpon pusillum]|uniref:Uncharacterized protein n=1 Tax=Endocarpon pusillum TaxID=364733 RepID=A0A8H7AKB3_9EURO|nr:hypothetical protein GJ744_006079 [Endocarpon pusillum]
MVKMGRFASNLYDSLPAKTQTPNIPLRTHSGWTTPSIPAGGLQPINYFEADLLLGCDEGVSYLQTNARTCLSKCTTEHVLRENITETLDSSNEPTPLRVFF